MDHSIRTSFEYHNPVRIDAAKAASYLAADPAVYPTVAVCDPSLTHGLPRGVTANSEFIERAGIAADRGEHRLTDDLLDAWTASGIRSYGITNAVRPLDEDDIRDILVSSLR